MTEKIIDSQLFDRYPPEIFERKTLLPPSYELILIEFARQASRLPDSNKITLDVGCGSGSAAKIFNQAGLSAFNLDLSLSALQISPRLGIQSFADALPLVKNSVTAIHSKDLLVHCPDKMMLLSEFSRILPSGGILLITSPETAGNYFDIQLGALGGQRRFKFESLEICRQMMEKCLKKGFGTVEPAYFPTFKNDVILTAERVGLECTKESFWQPKTEELPLDWFTNQNLPEKRFVLQFQKKSLT